MVRIASCFLLGRSLHLTGLSLCFGAISGSSCSSSACEDRYVGELCISSSATWFILVESSGSSKGGVGVLGGRLRSSMSPYVLPLAGAKSLVETSAVIAFVCWKTIGDARLDRIKMDREAGARAGEQRSD